MSGNAVERLALALGEAIGTEVELERPNDPAHGDYATSAAPAARPPEAPCLDQREAASRPNGDSFAREAKQQQFSAEE